MIYFPNCKINIGLFVTGKRDDGFHNIESVFYPVNLKDTLEMRITDNPYNNFTVKNFDYIKGVSNNDSNIVIKAYNLLKKDFPQIPNLNIFLLKKIPVFAGLGGGSSDGSYALKLINYMAELNLSEEQLSSYASELGSDCVFFIKNRPCFVYSKGEKMQKSNLDLTGLNIVIIKPDINIPTKEAYNNVNISHSCFDLRQLNRNDIANWKNYVRNDFEQSIFKKYPLLQQIKETLYDNGALYAQMSGSGSAVYGIFDKETDIENLPFNKDAFIYRTAL